MAKIESVEFGKFDAELIQLTWTNRIGSNLISLFIALRGDIQKVVDEVSDRDYPEWFTESFNNIISEFLQILKSGFNETPQAVQDKFYAFRIAILYDRKSSQFPFPSINYSLPFLENYAKTSNLSDQLGKLNHFNKSINDSIDNMQNTSLITLTSIEERFQKFKVEADSTLSLLNKQTGKIAVKEYAAIFEKQAYEHSNFFIDGEDANKKKYNFKCFGKAQRWISFALLAFVFLIFSFTQLDKFFSLKDQYIFTPEVVVHIVGRFLLISLFIFIVSFSFKQFRINMHLYTLNKHRANTLKSFEYLTKAPDQLSPDSYNAILMEVAKAIYESGQTGYINPNDNNTDIPSIIDMSKVITQPRV